MSKSSGRNLRRLWLNIHLWIGIGLSLVLIPLSISGSALVWHDALDELLNPSRYATSGADLLAPSAYLKAASEALGPTISPSTLRLPGEPGDPVIVSGRQAPTKPGVRMPTISVYLDPPTARVLDTANSRASVIGVLHVFHGTLMVPGVGRQIVGWFGVAMLVSSLTGIYLWWPRNGELLRALRWRRQPTTMANTHFSFGFWFAIPLAILSFTGAYISFPQTMRSAIGLFTEISPAQQRPNFSSKAVVPISSPDAIVAAAQAAAPNAQLLALSFPAGSNPVWRVQMKSANGQPLSFSVDDNNRKVKSNARPGAPASGDSFSRLMRNLHDGGDMGLIWQIVIFIGGILPAILAVTGLVMWLRKRNHKTALNRRLAAAPGD